MRSTGAIAFNAGAILVVSACGLIVEITAGRMLAPYVGMSLYTWTAIIAVVLAGFSVGHWVGGWLADSAAPGAFRWLAVIMMLGAATTAASPWLIRVFAGPVLSSSADVVTQISILAFALFFMPSLCAGVPSPVLSKIAIDRAPQRAGRVLGLMFAAGAIGAIAGTLLAGFLFISWVGSTGTILTVATTYAVLAAAFLSVSWRSHRARAASLLLPAVLVALAVRYAESAQPCDRESDYYCIRVIDVSGEVGQEARLMVLDHLGHGMNLRGDPATFLSPYVELMDLLVRAHFSGALDISAYFIGGGAYTLPRAWSLPGRGIRVTVAEVDPAVTATAREFFWADTDRMTVVHGDARAILSAQSPSGFDVIIGDAFKDIAVPAHLITREFAELVKMRLTPNGLYLVNLVDHPARLQALFSMVLTLRQVFPVVDVWVDRSQAQSGQRITFVIAAGQRRLGTDRLVSRSETGNSFLRWPDDDLAARLSAADAYILSDDFTPIDRLIGPQ